MKLLIVLIEMKGKFNLSKALFTISSNDSFPHRQFGGDINIMKI